MEKLNEFSFCGNCGGLRAFGCKHDRCLCLYTGEQQFGHQARITLDRARAIAVKARPGQITDQELEKEGGGSGLRFSFDVKSMAGKTYEVGVDAKTGKVLENKAEGPNPD